VSSRSLGKALLLVLSACTNGCDKRDSRDPAGPFQASWRNQGLVPSGNLRAVRAANDRQAIVAGEASSFYRTDDGGVLWFQQEQSPMRRQGDVLALDTLGNFESAFGVAVGRDPSGARFWTSQRDIIEWATHDLDDPDPTDGGNQPYTGVDKVLLDITYILRQDGKVILLSAASGTVLPGTPGAGVWNAIDFFGTTGKGFVAGNGGLLSKTVDNATNWVAQTHPAGTANWQKMYWLTLNEAFVCGSNGKVIRTLNADATPPTWSDVSTGVTGTHTLRSIHFPTATDGWVVGDNGTNGVIYRWNSGSSSWGSQTVPAGTERLYDVFFVDANVGFAAGDNGEVLKTTNGGTLWSRITAGPQAPRPNFTFADFSMGGAVGVAVAGDRIYKTLNGGDSWTLSSTVGGAPTLRGVSIPRAGGGLIAYVCGGAGLILRNDDITTSDTWTAQTVPGGFTNPSAILFPGDDLTGFCVGNANDVLKTTDGGVTTTSWATQALPAGGGSYASLDASGATIVIGGATGRLVFSLDSGATWNADTSSGETTAFQVVQAVGVGDVFALAADGSIWKAAIATGTPPTVTWTSVAGAMPAGFGTPVGMAWTSTLLGWVVSASGTPADLGRIALTTDGGATWSPSYEHTYSPLRAIRMISPTTGWAVGDNATILKTAFGGQIPP